MKFKRGDRVVRVSGSFIGELATVVSDTSANFSESIVLIRFDDQSTSQEFQSYRQNIALADEDDYEIDA